jgi:hypothetical protein
MDAYLSKKSRSFRSFIEYHQKGIMKNPIFLGVNIDHIATIRQARGTRYPDPIQAAIEAELAGADLITLHLREKIAGIFKIAMCCY